MNIVIVPHFKVEVAVDRFEIIKRAIPKYDISNIVANMVTDFVARKTKLQLALFLKLRNYNPDFEIRDSENYYTFEFRTEREQKLIDHYNELINSDKNELFDAEEWFKRGELIINPVPTGEIAIPPVEID